MPLGFEGRARLRDTADGQPNYIIVTADTYAELHRALAALAELHRDAEYLKAQTGAEVVVPERHVTDAGYEYLGFHDAAKPWVQQCFGSSTDTTHPVPYFPKRERGLYRGREEDHDVQPSPAPQSQRGAPPAQTPHADTRDDASRRAALVAFEAQAQLVQLTDDGCTALCKELGAVRPGDLDAAQLAHASEVIASPEEADVYNARGFTRRARKEVAAAPPRKRAEIVEKTTAEARDRFSGTLLRHVINTIEQAAAMPAGRAAA